MKLNKYIIATFLCLVAACSSNTPTQNSKLEPGITYQRVSLDEFSANQLAKPISLTFEIPSNYLIMEIPETGDARAYWMPENKFQAVEDTGNLPMDTGYIWGKISLNVGFNPSTGKFTNEDSIVAEHKNNGFTIKDIENGSINGYKTFSYLAIENKSGNRVYVMYVALNIATNAYYITYRPPSNSKETGIRVWSNLLRSME